MLGKGIYRLLINRFSLRKRKLYHIHTVVLPQNLLSNIYTLFSTQYVRLQITVYLFVDFNGKLLFECSLLIPAKTFLPAVYMYVVLDVSTIIMYTQEQNIDTYYSEQVFFANKTNTDFHNSFKYSLFLYGLVTQRCI